jgi:hypothetical protein
VQPDSSTAPQEALEALQRELSARESVLHFAHAAVSTILALIAAGTSAKMYWDLTGERTIYAAPVLGFASVCFVYGAIRYLIGRRVLKRELESFAKLQSLRRQLGRDDTSKLLPR